MNAPRNISASLKARLQNVAATRGEEFNLLLLRYGIEHLLFRLSQSPHADRFQAQRFEFDGPTLRRAIDATFARRQTNLPLLPEALTAAFADDPAKQEQWAAFLRRNRLAGIPEQSSEVAAEMRQFFVPMLRLR